MAPHAWAPARPGRRLAAALVVSALVHLFLFSALITGAGRGVLSRSASRPVEPRPLAIRIDLPTAVSNPERAVAQRERPASGLAAPTRETRTTTHVPRP